MAFEVSTRGWRKVGGGGRRRVWVLLRKMDSLKISRRDCGLWQSEKVGM